ncbi:MAG: hypothetical protein Q9163_004511 [Psora crenata]
MSHKHILEHFARGFLLQPRQNAAPTALPPGVIPNYDNPNTTGNQVVITSLTLIVFSSLFVVTRLAIKWRLVKRWGLDDSLITLAFLLALARAIVSTINAQKYDLGYHVWDIKPEDLIVKGEMQKNVRCVLRKEAYGTLSPTQLTEIYQATFHWRYALPYKHHVHENRDPVALRPALWS